MSYCIYVLHLISAVLQIFVMVTILDFQEFEEENYRGGKSWNHAKYKNYSHSLYNYELSTSKIVESHIYFPFSRGRDLPPKSDRPTAEIGTYRLNQTDLQLR